MALSRLDPSEPGGIPVKAVWFRGVVIGHASTTREASILAKAAGADVHPTNPFQGSHWAVDGTDRFTIEVKVQE